MVALEPVQAAGPFRVITMGSQKVAEAPTDGDFARAAVWRVKLGPGVDSRRNLLLRVQYTGDVARMYLDGKLLTDDFYNGNAFEIGLNRLGPDIYRRELLLKVLPLNQDAPIYFSADVGIGPRHDPVGLAVKGAEVVETRTVELEFK